jgi:uncharacterized protein YjiS (DUF1127 family)
MSEYVIPASIGTSSARTITKLHHTSISPATLWWRFVRRRAASQALRDLRALDDRTLTDIGLTQDQLLACDGIEMTLARLVAR